MRVAGEREDEQDNTPLTEEELSGGPLVQETMAVPLLEAAAIKPIKLPNKPLFDERGVATGVVMRPCVSRGRRIRNMPPRYSPRMLAESANVFTGWLMYIDHLPARVAEELEERERYVLDALPPALAENHAKRSVLRIGGQALRSWYDPEYVREDDEEHAYEHGATLAEYWATPFIRGLANENPNLFHTSINAWPTGGKPTTHKSMRVMEILGIRRKPEGSWDYVPRGGAGGRLQAADEELMVSVCESVYDSRVVQIDLAKTNAADLRSKLRSDFPQLAEELGIKADDAPANTGGGGAPPVSQLSEADVQRMIEKASEGRSEPLSEQQLSEKVTELAEDLLAERDEQRALAAAAHELIEAVDGLGSTWKADLKARYSVTPDGPTPALVSVIEAAEQGDKTPRELIEARIEDDVKHVSKLHEEAGGKPLVRGEGGGGNNPERAPVRESKTDDGYSWRDRAIELGLAESEEELLEAEGVEFEKPQKAEAK